MAALLKAVLLLLAVAMVAAGAFAFWYSRADRASQVRVESAALEALDAWRFSKETPRSVRAWLDGLSEKIPLSREDGVALERVPEESFAVGGFPAGPSEVHVLLNRGYVVGYDEARKNPAWVAYKLVPQKEAVGKRPSRFSADPRTQARVKAEAYSNSGYDRGHMAPNFAIAADYGPEAQRETFLMSNIAPQKPDLNRKVWESLEEREISNYAPRFREIWVFTGPIYDNPAAPKRLPGGVAVPDAFFKIIADHTEDGRLRLMAFILPQDVQGGAPLQPYATSVDEVERRTGLDFFTLLPPDVQERLESRRTSRVW